MPVATEQAAAAEKAEKEAKKPAPEKGWFRRAKDWAKRK